MIDVTLPSHIALARAYAHACATPSDINEHLPTLRMLASRCEHVTEMGVRHGVSTLALLSAKPRVLRCYDIERYPEWEKIQLLASETDLRFIVGDSRTIDIDETDLLFIDTWHVYEQLKVELARHAGKARKYIAMHDTVTFGARGETPPHGGLWQAVEEFLAASSQFKIKQHYTNNNGLTVLERQG